ncbi:subtilisin-like protease SBT4.4 [Euphorbia lathyris]|uniref:subtilisin-like protease SBT4.4 n=1 Tax=Euphorbia lathyris TaxID=212925 RepID=UPI0033142F73
MGALRNEDYSPSSHHLSLLQGVTKSSSAEHILVRSYKRSFNGFAAMLSDSEAKQLQSSNEVVSVFPSITYQLQTTRSWSFLGFNETTHQNPSAESNVIIGVIDTGIWPESQSFSDEGFNPPPKKWKGSCKGGLNFTCNNKIIGARHYISNSSRDEVGHGTHTASTAAGNKVKDASFLGLEKGVARGGVPSARIAAYQVCAESGCGGAEILAAFDDAIADGVDIITISLGSTSSVEYDKDVIAIGAFHAMEKGILTSHSAGNSGPYLGWVGSVAPWILSVAAGSTDRRIIDKVILGNGKELIGNSVNSFDLKGESFPVINGSDARTADCSETLASSCMYECLNSSLVKGKIVVCDDQSGANEAMRAGAVGSILKSSGDFEDISFTWPLPALVLTDKRFRALGTYLNSSRHPVAKLLKSEEIKDTSAPIVASFSSRGPNLIVPDLLKPDIVAPGVAILAAYPPTLPPTTNAQDTRRVSFNVLSGTSMACPHAAGIAAYIKTFHPKWSPSAIKSAIMTTALPLNATVNSGAEFAYGSGGINPLGAIHPGLVYDATKADYITFLCGTGYNETAIRAISGDNTTSCPQGDKKAWPKDFNYPSLAARIPANKSFTISFTRTVTNVGIPISTYKAEVLTDSKVKIKVVPSVLPFKYINEKKSFTVTVSGGGLAGNQLVNTLSASLLWSDGSHIVRSPILVYTCSNTLCS